MAKLKTPLLGLEAHGSIGNSVTYQSRGQTKIVRSKPQLPYFLTLPSQYQRWLYQDYAHLWTQQTLATKQIYTTAGNRFHLTGFQYWMKYNLTNLPDILAYWKLDDASGPTTPDSSKNENTCTIFGASPAVGRIDGCLYFDGLNDFCDCGTIGYDWTNEDWTAEAWASLNTGADDQYRGITGIRFGAGAGNWWTLGIYSVSGVRVELSDIGSIEPGVNPAGQGFKHYAVQKLGTIVTLFIDGINKGSLDITTNNIGDITNDLYLGRWFAANQIWKGLIDNVILRNRALSQIEITRHAQRRWPP